jgi:signal transduction histidine kinase
MFRELRRRNGSISKVELLQVAAVEAWVEEPEAWEAPEPLATLVHLGQEALDCVRAIPFRLPRPEDREELLASALAALLAGILLGRFFRGD